jgi:hypothetical protein
VLGMASGRAQSNDRTPNNNPRKTDYAEESIG